MSAGREVQDWGARERLPAQTIDVLLEQGFETLDDLRALTPDDVTDFQKTGLLPLAKCITLKKAIARLSEEGATPMESSPASVQPRSPSYSPPDRGYSPPEVSVKPGGSSSVSQLRTTFGSDPMQDAYQPRKSQYTSQHPRNQPLFEYERIAKQGGGDRAEFRFLLLGKTGSGKSTTGNTIFGAKKFCSDVTFGSVTSECELQRNVRAGTLIEIMDSPGLYDTHKTQDEICTIIVQAVACMHPGPHAVLYVVKLGRYTAEEFGAYRRLKALFDEAITKYIIVIFTGGDELEKTNKTFDDLMKNAPKELKQVLEECGRRSLIFNNKASNPAPQVEQLLDVVRRLKAVNGGPYVCPKYQKIGQGLEEEVAKRLAVVDKKELERQKYVQELEKKTKVAEEDLRKKKAEMEKKEQERQRQLQEEEKKRREELVQLRRQMEQQKMSEERRRQEERELQARMEQERREFMAEMERQRKEERLEMEKREAERLKLERERLKEEREAHDRKEERYRKEMMGMKDRIARNEERGFFEKVFDTVTHPVRKAWNWLTS